MVTIEGNKHTRVLVVEDDEPLAVLLRYNLEAEGYSVDVVYRGDEAETTIAESSPDLVVLDWMLPGLSGLELCRRLRANKDIPNVPIILLTARSEEDDRIEGLTAGADDYVVKPFSVPELMARVRAILRRTRPDPVTSVLSVGDIQLDRQSHRVWRAGRDVQLGPTEFRLLDFLLQNPNRVFGRTQLLASIWGQDFCVDERTIDVHIGRLRKALVRHDEINPIRTVHGVGYALDKVEENNQRT